MAREGRVITVLVRLDNRTVTIYNDHVIKVKIQNDVPFVYILDIYTFVTFIDSEAIRQYNTVKLLMPLFYHLLETIQRSNKPKDFLFLSKCGKPLKLFHVDLFI